MSAIYLLPPHSMLMRMHADIFSIHSHAFFLALHGNSALLHMCRHFQSTTCVFLLAWHYCTYTDIFSIHHLHFSFALLLKFASLLSFLIYLLIFCFVRISYQMCFGLVFPLCISGMFFRFTCLFLQNNLSLLTDIFQSTTCAFFETPTCAVISTVNLQLHACVSC